MFEDLKTGIDPNEWAQGDTREVNGYREYAAYPTGYQAAEFPLHGEDIRLAGSNQAFFFVRGVKNAANEIVDIQLNTSALKTLIGNIAAMRDEDKPCAVRLQIDVDVFKDPKRFVDKYQGDRPESDELQRRFLLGKEAALIRKFVDSDGIPNLVAEVLQENAQRKNAPLGAEELAEKVRVFLIYNFKLEGLETETALRFATWEILTPERRFLARQEYEQKTLMTDRRWRLGWVAALHTLSMRGHAGGKAVIDAVWHTNEIPHPMLTYGLNRGHPLEPGHPPQRRKEPPGFPKAGKT